MSRRLPFSLAVLAGVALFNAGCQVAPERPGLPPSLKLLESTQLVVPDGCKADTSLRVEFRILENGRTERIRVPEGPDCMREALVAWVESFRYAPSPMAMDGSVEWLLVTGRRGS